MTAIPDTEHTDGVVDVTDGVMPDVAETETLKGVADQVLVLGFVNEMVFAVRWIVTVCAEDDFEL